MANEMTELQQQLESGGEILLAEIAPPASGDGAVVRARAKCYAGKVHALGISDNRDEARMSALAAASLAAAEGVEPLLHLITRDRNRIALVSECLGAAALGVRNVLCTSGNHQTLGRFRKAKNVFDVDSTQLLEIVAGLGDSGAVVGTEKFAGAGPFCLGAVASPEADPREFQLRRLAKKAEAGARFFITQPVFDVERFREWWNAATETGLPERAAVIAGIQLLASAEQARAAAADRLASTIPEEALKRITSASSEADQRAAGIQLAVETIARLSELPGLRGFELRGDGDDEAALQVIAESGRGI
jgi:5,10-methylenetetrahydrofolate reductase